MKHFNFYELFDDTEFQHFARDMIQIRDNITFEGFGKGRDGAMDGYYIDQAGKITILQVKHYKQHNITHLKNEAEKVKKIKPDKYILVLSYDIIHDTKKEIMSLFHPYIRNSNDILTNDDLNNLIHDASGKYKCIKDK